MEWSYKDKLRFFIGTLAIIAGVLLMFKYVFPIIWPLAAGMLVAYLIDRPVSYIAGFCIFKGKKTVPAIMVVAVLLLVIGVATILLVRIVMGEIQGFTSNMDDTIVYGQQMVSQMCCNVDEWLGMNEGQTYRTVLRCKETLADTWMGTLTGTKVGDSITTISNIISKVLTVSIPVMRNIIIIISEIMLMIIATVYISGAFAKIREAMVRHIFAREIEVVKNAVVKLVRVYLKVELIIMVINAMLCVVTLMLLNNPYALIIGVIIGLIDALPIFGTGTVLIPWILLELLMKEFGYAAVLSILFIATYAVREIMESKCLGDRMGVAPFTMLASIFLGIMVFGIMGFVTGPLAYCISKELVLHLKRIIESDKLGIT